MKTIMTFNLPEVVKGIRAVKIKRDSEWDEYQVCFIGCDGKIDQDQTYFTDDKQDAFDTAELIINNMRAV